MKRFLSASTARFGMAMAALVGLFASCYLLYTYVNGGPIACGIVHGCEVVRASKWAKTVFGLPRPLLGVLFYTVLYGLLVFRSATNRHAKWLYRLTLLFAAVGFFESGVLFIIQWIDLKAFCMWCLMSGLSSLFVAIFAFFDQMGPETERAQKELRRLFMALLVFIPVLFLGMYLLLRPSSPEASTLPESTLSASTGSSTSTPSVRDILLLPETPTLGNASSSVLVVEFLDFECPACRAFYPTMKRIQDEYAGRVQFAVRQFPLWEIHKSAKLAGVAAECARRQGRFFPYADVLYQKDQDLSEAGLIKKATDLGLNESRFRLCLADPSVTKFVETERAFAVRLGLQYTPTIFVNRLKIDQALPYEDLKKVIDQELAKTP